jgi:hypothetical protein
MNKTGRPKNKHTEKQRTDEENVEVLQTTSTWLF